MKHLIKTFAKHNKIRTTLIKVNMSILIYCHMFACYFGTYKIILCCYIYYILYMLPQTDTKSGGVYSSIT